MKDTEITKFLVCFSGQIEYVCFPGGVFDDQIYIQYEAIWGPDWNPMSGLTSGTSQMARSGLDPERVVFSLPFEMIEYVCFPGGVFDDQIYIQYEAIWGPDWNPMSGLTSGTSQMARSGLDPERVVFSLPFVMVLSSTNVSGWPQLLITVRAQNSLTGEALRGYSLFLMPPTTGHVRTSSSLIRPRAATLLGEWLAWLTGKYPELADPKMLAIGKDNYLLRTESYGAVTVSMNMVSKDFRKLGYDNQPPA